MQGQLTQFETRRSEIAAQLATGNDPIEGLESERQTYLNQRLLVDRQLVEARQALQEQRRRTAPPRTGTPSHRAGAERAARSRSPKRACASRNTVCVRRRCSDAITEAGFELEAIFAAVPAEAEAAQWQGELAELEQKIRRLEPVNLAAIQEYEEQSQRKEYLDAQFTDLTTALETLEDAIRKIDKETRARFKDTFDRVNTGVQELFPRLFGGGHAYLELTGEDLLDDRRGDHGASARQARTAHLAAVRRREGADRGRAGVLDLPAESGAVLPAGRGGRAARRGQRRPLLRHGHAR